MAEERKSQGTRATEAAYDSRLFQVGVLWRGTSNATGKPILTGEMSLGLMGPRDVLITENNRPDKGEHAPTHLVFIRVPQRRSGNGTGYTNSQQSADGLDF